MPRRCSVFGCRSNYDGESERVTTFSLPKEAGLRNQWLGNIPTDFSKLKHPIVCIKHFDEASIILSDTVMYKGELKHYPREIPKLAENSVPSIFPQAPSYLSSPAVTVRRLVDVEKPNMEEAISNSLADHTAYLERGKITCLEDIVSFSKDKFVLRSNWTLVKNDSKKTMYYIVEFAETKEIAIAPLCWLNEEKNKCRWPPFKSEVKLTNSMRKAELPEREWSMWDVRCLHVFDSYDEAKRKLAAAEMMSDLATKLPDREEGSKRKRQCIRDDIANISCELKDKFSESLLPHSPDSPQFVNEPSPLVPTPPAPSTSAESTVSASELLSLPSDSQSVVEIAVFEPHEFDRLSPGTGYSSNNLAQAKEAQPCPCCKLIMSEIQELKLQLEMHTHLLSQLLEGNNGKTDNVTRPGLPASIKHLLPISSVDDLRHINEYLADDTNFLQCCRYFSTLGGNNSKDATRRILQHMISHEVSLQMNWKGRGYKQAFQNYQNVIDLVYRSVVQIPLCQLTTLSDTENEIKNWLRFAADRYGGRSKRLSQVSPT